MVKRKLQSILNYFGLEIRRVGTLSPTAIFSSDLKNLILGCSEAIERYPVHFITIPNSSHFFDLQVNIIDVNNSSILDVEEFLVFSSQSQRKIFKVENFFLSYPDVEKSNE